MGERKLVFVFPGQGSQKKGMLSDLAEEHAVIRETLEEASDVLGYDMKTLCFEDPQSQLGLTEFTQPSLLATSTAIWRLLKLQSPEALKSPIVAGHSLGEYSALVALGLLRFDDALRLVQLRGQAMQAAVPVGTGGMSALVGDGAPEWADVLCKEVSEPGSVVEVANENSPSQLVVSGHKSALERFGEAAKAKKAGRVIPLPVSAPFHSTLMQPASDKMKEALAEVVFGTGEGQIVANVDAKLYNLTTYTRDLLVRQVVSRVRWTATTEFFLRESRSKDAQLTFVEVGSGAVLQGLVRKTLAHPAFADIDPASVHLQGTDSPEAVAGALTALGG